VAPTQRSEREWEFELPIDADAADWQIGLVIGASGSGKTTLAREAWKDAPFVTVGTGYEWPDNKAVVDGFPADMSVKDVCAALSSVGFSTPPAWLRPFRVLSTGEQFRATIARVLLDPAPLVVVDEFTSVIDRTVAKIGSAAVAKAVRRVPGKRIVCVTCHSDVEEWLCPDWVVEMPSGQFTRRSLRRPPISMEIIRTDRSAWDIFKHHHYLDTSLHPASKCFVAMVDNRPAAFASCMHSPGHHGGWWREHRTVCLPDFQGVGIGNTLSEFVGGHGAPLWPVSCGRPCHGSAP
jgi:ABC-type lipoprotein export system ATPase subunit